MSGWQRSSADTTRSPSSIATRTAGPPEWPAGRFRGTGMTANHWPYFHGVKGLARMGLLPLATDHVGRKFGQRVADVPLAWKSQPKRLERETRFELATSTLGR